MPICTTCTYKISHLYTVYESANNLRLEQCPKCLNFADPYVEHDSLTLLLDLILLKRDVFRHLLFNRGYQPRRASKASSPSEADKKDRTRIIELQREKDRWELIFQLGIVLIFVDAYGHISTETIAFHLGIALMSAAVLKSIRLWKSILSQVPLTLLYSSLTKLFLLLLLALWKPSSVPSSQPSLPRNTTEASFFRDLMAHDVTRRALEMLDDDKLDREWVVRNVLGGMAAGFGLRVVLDIQPVFTTIIILTGWAAKTFVAAAVSTWVNKGDLTGDVFLAYSIP
ncbi:Arv1-domain-containing protein [Fomitiporia mediterranea MF3/22]|uniref:Arv1-domain-containing protein n=1 Tax=Fomitiporia mediterranea (strain MF3/22) TaxID=694068 RepID=UPI00044091E6|nr:Arv1-domain-containing protein [Fomitiporia mediterranea MF3/22]EJD06744.1 Arv1-domain-containing protein [Fomitiporia mediterranea MF3/22]